MVAKFVRRFSHFTTAAAGSPFAVGMAFGSVAAWFAGGWLRFGFGDHYQMVINTGTTIITFVMVFLIQNTTNRDSKAMHAKLDEIIRAAGSARNEMIALEECDDEAIDAAREDLRRRRGPPPAPR